MNSNQTDACDIYALYDPHGTVTPTALLWLGVVHNCCIAVLGTLSNMAALWCVATSTTTRRPVKLLLMSVFVPVLVICVASRPLVIETLLALLTCDTGRISMTFMIINNFLYSVFAQSELAYIAVIAVIRVVAVWSSRKFEMGMKLAAAVVSSVFAYSFITGIAILGAMLTNRVEGKAKDALQLTYFFLATMLPLMVTVTSYVLMIIAVQRNRRRLAASQQQSCTKIVMDQPTRAMLAVFISNLVFGLPHAIYHLMGDLPHYFSVIFHMLFSAHFVVDPLLFIYFNIHHRQRVLDLVSSCWFRPSKSSNSSLNTNGLSLSSLSKNATR